MGRSGRFTRDLLGRATLRACQRPAGEEVIVLAVGLLDEQLRLTPSARVLYGDWFLAWRQHFHIDSPSASREAHTTPDGEVEVFHLCGVWLSPKGSCQRSCCLSRQLIRWIDQPLGDDLCHFCRRLSDVLGKLVCCDCQHEIILLLVDVRSTAVEPIRVNCLDIVVVIPLHVGQTTVSTDDRAKLIWSAFLTEFDSLLLDDFVGAHQSSSILKSMPSRLMKPPLMGYFTPWKTKWVSSSSEQGGTSFRPTVNVITMPNPDVSG